MADSVLEAARGEVAKAASPEASGRCPTLTLLAVEGEAGTLDPAFAAHVGPVQHWALAVWCRWFPEPTLEHAFAAAGARLAAASGSIWGSVTGPTTALIATTSTRPVTALATAGLLTPSTRWGAVAVWLATVLVTASILGR